MLRETIAALLNAAPFKDRLQEGRPAFGLMEFPAEILSEVKDLFLDAFRTRKQSANRDLRQDGGIG
jgi:hypothetical protein